MKYDLMIRDGEIVDPGSGLRGRMDVAIAGGKIAEVAPSLAEADACKTISAKDRLVIPGLVDVHAHIFVNCSDMGEHTDRLCNSSGVTTVCDAGSAGSANFAGLRFVIDKAVRTRTRAFVNLSAIGIVGTARSGGNPEDERSRRRLSRPRTTLCVTRSRPSGRRSPQPR
jgi:dihydroorotase